MLKFFLIILKLEKGISMLLRKYLFLIRYFPHPYKTQKMCDKIILENGGTLKSSS